MSQSPYLFKDDVYKEFKALERASYRDVIQYYEINKYKIQLLDIEWYFEILYAYGLALFELGMHQRYLQVAEEVLGLSIEHNIIEIEHEDVYGSTLFRKAASHFHLQERDKAEHIIRQLLHIHPLNDDARQFYCRLQISKRKYSGFTRGLSVILLLSSALFIAIELLVFRPFYADWVSRVEIFRNALFASGLGTYLFGEVFNRLAVYYRLRRDVQEILKKKQGKPV
jgi:tetratricopeptide (TPR) repeat protein